MKLLTLKEYLELTGTQKQVFAREIGISKAALCNYMSGKRIPPLALAFLIQQKTKGRVPMAIWLKELPN
jgi:transcriptional regulator with XRE-family HTH domain